MLSLEAAFGSLSASTGRPGSIFGEERECLKCEERGSLKLVWSWKLIYRPRLTKLEEINLKSCIRSLWGDKGTFSHVAIFGRTRGNITGPISKISLSRGNGFYIWEMQKQVPWNAENLDCFMLSLRLYEAIAHAEKTLAHNSNTFGTDWARAAECGPS